MTFKEFDKKLRVKWDELVAGGVSKAGKFLAVAALAVAIVAGLSYGAYAAFWFVLGIPSMIWNAGIWPDPKSEFMQDWFGNGAPLIIGMFKVLAEVAVIGTIVIVATWLWPTKKAKPKTETPKTEAEKASETIRRQTQSSWQVPFWVTVPTQYGAGIYWWFGGQGSYVRSIGEGIHLKWPVFQTVVMVDRLPQDITIPTPQLPTGIIKMAEIDRDEPKSSGIADRSAAKLEKKRQRAVSGTLSYELRMTTTVRSEDGIETILRTKAAYRDFKSQDLRDRFTDLISARLKMALSELKFEDAFFLPAMVILLGNQKELYGDDGEPNNELIGSKRWTRLLDENTKDKTLLITLKDTQPDGSVRERPVNVFRINLADPRQVIAAISDRPDSLLRTFYDLGYKIMKFAVKDVNPPKDLEDQLKLRVMAEIRRDAKYTDYISEQVDQAEAISAGRNIQSRASVYDFDVNLDALERAYKKLHGNKPFEPTLEQLLWLQNFREDRRTRRLMGGRITVMDIGADSPIPTSLRPLLGVLAQEAQIRAGAGATEGEGAPSV